MRIIDRIFGGLNITPTLVWGRIQRVLPNTRLATRLATFYGVLFLSVLIASAALVAPAVSSVVLRQARTDAQAAALVIERNWQMRGEEMARAVELAALDYGFRAAIASGDRDTIASAITNTSIRLGFEHSYFIGLDGMVVDTARSGGGPAPLIADGNELALLLETASSASGALPTEQDIFQAAFSPVRAPNLLGWLLIAQRLDQQHLQETVKLIGLPVSLRAAHTESEMSDGFKRRDDRWSMEVSTGLDSLGSAEEPNLGLVVSYPLRNAIAPYLAPLRAIAVVILLGVIVFLLGCVALAGTFIRPIGQLTLAAKSLAEGGDAAVEIGRDDEIGELGNVFNSMSAEIRQRENDLKALLAEQANLYDQAMVASRAKSEFLMTVGHELRTPLNAIIGYGELISENAGTQLQDSVTEDAQEIVIAGSHLLELINQILDLSKVEAHKIALEVTKFDISALLQTVVAMVRPAAVANNVKIILSPGSNCGSAVTDEFRLKQCLLNVVSNAVKFSPNGNVTISSRREPGESDDDIVIDISDTGIGMTPDQLERVFLPFEQADASTTRQFGGTGLGLPIARGLARALAGEISATSLVGRGSTFTLRVTANLENLSSTLRAADGQPALQACVA